MNRAPPALVEWLPTLRLAASFRLAVASLRRVAQLALRSFGEGGEVAGLPRRSAQHEDGFESRLPPHEFTR